MNPLIQSLLQGPTPNTYSTPPIAGPVPQGDSTPQKYVEKDPKHTGVAGVARDVLGTLGDFLLTRLHMKPMYAPAQERRRLAAATANYDSDPVGAIQQASSIDPVFGAKLRDQQIDNQRQQAALESVKETREQRLANQRAGIDQGIRRYAGSMLGSMATWDDKKRQTYYPQVRDKVILAAKRQGLDLSSELPEEYDPISLDAFIEGAVPVERQKALRLQRDRLDETVSHNDVTEAQGQARINETGRHNRVTEGQGEQRIGISAQRAATAAAKGPRITNVQSYTGEDGYRYTQRSDGTTVKSPVKVRPAGKPQAGPPVGYKNKYGLVFQGGDYNNRANWK